MINVLQDCRNNGAARWGGGCKAPVFLYRRVTVARNIVVTTSRELQEKHLNLLNIIMVRMLNILTAWFHNVHVYKNNANMLGFITGIKRGVTIIFGAVVRENASGNQ